MEGIENGVLDWEWPEKSGLKRCLARGKLGAAFGFKTVLSKGDGLLSWKRFSLTFQDKYANAHLTQAMDT